MECRLLFRALEPFVLHLTHIGGWKMEKAADAGRQGQQSELPDYEKPSIRMMDEKEVLSAFQVTVAATTWWVM
jgi:hypothetical protein